jgi:hypothetical protein
MSHVPGPWVTTTPWSQSPERPARVGEAILEGDTLRVALTELSEGVPGTSLRWFHLTLDGLLLDEGLGADAIRRSAERAVIDPTRPPAQSSSLGIHPDPLDPSALWLLRVLRPEGAWSWSIEWSKLRHHP